jgi:hypothetical protein
MTQSSRTEICSATFGGFAVAVYSWLLFESSKAFSQRAFTNIGGDGAYG